MGLWVCMDCNWAAVFIAVFVLPSVNKNVFILANMNTAIHIRIVTNTNTTALRSSIYVLYKSEILTHFSR